MPRFLRLTTFICLCIISISAYTQDKKPLRFDFVNQQISAQKLDELKAITTPEMVAAQAEYYRKLYQALVTSGFSKDEALKIVIAKASAK
ncbi:hypothetical protein L0668_12760 [Paraglaciecola aquimarina]|uniref:Uncharacterized protein n=1 Tax=Paraglaciecola algarum TaxID=3050085 RepID=A0ABS9D867_9ALTE|nr:hypothetical protein [Paraglaciecola sp. G1-23]MCF2948985.1 hypothetical protein [Paraglaciecola sp. G1-23]